MRGGLVRVRREPRAQRPFGDARSKAFDQRVQMDARNWPRAKEILAARFRTRARDEWLAFFAGTDACVSPVLDLKEAYEHPHMKERGTFIDVAGVMQPAPAPRFSRTKLPTPQPSSRMNTENARAALQA